MPRLLRLLPHLLHGLWRTALALLVAVMLAAGLWAGHERSLAHALQWTAAALRDPTTRFSPLTVENATGNLHHGGRIGRLRWRHKDWDVEIEDLDVRWPGSLWFDALLGRRLALDQLSARTVRVHDGSPPDPEGRKPPRTLALPWLRSVSTPLQVQSMHLDMGTAVSLGPLQLRYRYGIEALQGPFHHVDTLTVQWAQGSYQGEAHLQAEGHMALHASLHGQIPTALPGGRHTLLHAQAQADGTLGTHQAALQLHADVQTAGPDSAPSHPQHAPAPTLHAEATVHPWADMPVPRATLALQGIDLASLWPQAPRTDLHGQWTIESTEAAQAPTQWQLQGELTNRHPGPLDLGQLPVRRLRADLRLQGPTWRLEDFSAEVAGGQLQAHATASVSPPSAQPTARTWPERLSHWEGELQGNGLRSDAVWSTWRMQPVDVHAQASAAKTGETEFQAHLTPQAARGDRTPPLPAPQLDVQGLWKQTDWHLHNLQWRVWGLEGKAQGVLQPRQQRFTGDMTLHVPGAEGQFHGTLPWGRAGPARSASAPPGTESSPNGADVQLHMSQAQTLHTWLIATLNTLDTLPTARNWVSQAQGLRSLTDVQGEAQLALQWNDTPPWSALANAFQSGTAAPGDWSLRADIPTLRFTLNDAHSPVTLRNAHGEWLSSGRQARWRQSGELTAGPWTTLLTLQAQAQLGPDGTKAGRPQAQLQIDALDLQAHEAQRPWQWHLQTLGTPVVRWQGGTANAAGNGLSVLAGQAQLQLSPRGEVPHTPLSRQPVTIAWENSRWALGQLSSRGRAQGLALSWLNALLSSNTAPQGPLLQAGLSGDVLFDADWELALPWQSTPPGPPPIPAQARLRLQRTSGDLALLNNDDPKTPPLNAGLSDVMARLTLEGSTLRGQLRWLSQNAGQIQAEGQTELQAPSAPHTGWSWPAQAPVSGQLQAQLPQLGLWSRFAPPGWRVRGRLQADATVGGVHSRPEWHGTLQASELSLRSLLEGLDFNEGHIQARFDGDTVRIDSLRFKGAGGRSDGEAGGLLLGSGLVQWAPAANAPPQPGTPTGPRLDLQLQAQQLRLLARADRRLTLTGTLQSRWQGQQLQFNGQLRADQALFVLPDDSTPTLGNDVKVRGQKTTPTGTGNTALQTTVNVDLQLGDNFQIRGQGLNTHLEGSLHIGSKPGQTTPQLTGQVRTLQGTYRAYGQTLTIEEGLLSFNGPYDNPALDILALRPHPTQRVGVQISGQAQAPHVRLYAEPELPDSEKLAWLVLGRPASGTGAQAAVLQQAARALLSGQGRANDGAISRALGLDDITVQGESQNANGSTAPAAVTLGKRFSNQLYMSYSRSLAGAMGTVAVFYDISRYLTLRAQAGDDNAVDLVYTHKYD